MNYVALIDAPSALIVFGGTLCATLLRCGPAAFASALHGIATALHPQFNASRARAGLAVQIQDIHRDGLLRAEPHLFGDREFDDVTGTLIERRSVSALAERHRYHRHVRVARSKLAVATLDTAAETAPAFGLAGTLIALSQIAPTDAGAGASGGILATSIPAAIVTTFYGLMAAQLLFAPLARLVERRALREEQERQKLLDWLAMEVEPECSDRQSIVKVREVA